MQLLKRFKEIFTGTASGKSSRNTLSIYVLTRRCNEPVQAEINLLNELSPADEVDSAFFVRKVVHGSGKHRCFAQAEVLLWFDANRQLLRHEVKGGRWLTKDEYLAELERFNAPPEEETDEEALPPEAAMEGPESFTATESTEAPEKPSE
jgi:hypothetical protein